MTASLFYAYAPCEQDEMLLLELDKHLTLFQRLNLLSTWHRYKVIAGQDIYREEAQQLQQADIILLLLSPDFMQTDYCYSQELKQAVQKHERGEGCVIPIVLRPIYYEGSLFAHLPMLPVSGKAVSSYGNHIHEAFVEIAHELGRFLQPDTVATPISQLAQAQTRASQLQPDALIVILLNALTYGAALDQQSSEQQAAFSLYQRLKMFLNQCMLYEQDAPEILAQFEGDPDGWSDLLKARLLTNHADKDADSLLAANQLLLYKQQAAKQTSKFTLNGKFKTKYMNVGDYATFNDHE